MLCFRTDAFSGIKLRKAILVFWMSEEINYCADVFAQEAFPMQIDGMREFFSKIAPSAGPAAAQGKFFLSVVPAPTPQARPIHDSLSLSELGKRLSLNRGESSSLLEGRKADSVDSLPSWAQPMDKVLSQTIDILERMRKLAVAAQDKKLTDLERIEMQIEIEDLRANLNAVPRTLLRKELQVEYVSLQEAYAALFKDGSESFGDCSSVLERARDRILNGQEWDVREAWSRGGFIRVTRDENGEDVQEVGAGNAWHVVDDRNVVTRVWQEGKYVYVDSGRKVPTVRERLEKASPVVVMDAQSAARGIGYLEKRIASARKFREQLPELIEQSEQPKWETYVFLERLIFPDGNFKEVLTEPDIASYHLLHDGIYDYPYFSRPLVKPDGSDPSLVERKSLEDKWVAANRANESGDRTHGLSVPKLHEEDITLHNVKTIQVQGFSKQKE